MRDDEFMRIALETAWNGVKQGEAPFGACLVKEGRVVVRVHNVARRSWDITAHAEVQAIRDACRMLKTLDLSDTVLYATCEPCPMCFSASVWASFPGSCTEPGSRMPSGWASGRFRSTRPV